MEKNVRRGEKKEVTTNINEVKNQLAGIRKDYYKAPG